MNARLPHLFVLILGAVIAACTRSETPSAADAALPADGRPEAGPRDAEVDAMKSDAERQVDRFRAAAHRICREICECASKIVGATTNCASGSNECCTEIDYLEEDGTCETAYFETFTRMAGLCAGG